MDTITVEKREAIQEARSRLVDLLIAETTVEDSPDDSETDDPGTWLDDSYEDDDDVWSEPQNNNSC
jgi:hypothetical protein